MLRSSVAVLSAAVLLLAPGAAHASTRVTAAYAYFTKATDGTGGGNLWIAYRTNPPLPLDSEGTPMVEGENGGYVISQRERCYGDNTFYNQGVPRPRYVRLRLGKNGSVANVRLRVLRPRPGYGQGGLIGCAQDPAVRIYTSNLSYSGPVVRPNHLQLDTGPGPMLEHLHWDGWGSRLAIGYGTYTAEWSSQDPEELDVRPARLILSQPRMCSDYEALTYTRFTLITWDHSDKRHVKHFHLANICEASADLIGAAG